MEIQSSTTFSQQVRTLTKADDKHANGPVGQQVSELAHARNAAKAELRANALLLEATLTTSFSASDNPQALVLKTAIEGINEALKETLGENAIQNAYESGLDVSPEATADRIVSLSTAFFGAYQEANPELSQEDALNQFVDVIRGGIDQGFAEAREILEGLNVLEGDIATNIDLTYDLVQQGLDNFLAQYLNTGTPEETQTT